MGVHHAGIARDEVVQRADHPPDIDAGVDVGGMENEHETSWSEISVSQRTKPTLRLGFDQTAREFNFC
jgi:hypothetical protein